MFNIIRLCLGTIARLFCARRSLLLENLVLRQQLAVYKRRHPRPRPNLLDKLFWVVASQVWSDWKQFLIFVLPETVVQWHRAGFSSIGACCPKSAGSVLADAESRRRFGI
jgi:hypothetical protein